MSKYKYELIVLLSFMVMGGAWFYKHQQSLHFVSQKSELESSIYTLQEVIALKDIWGTKSISKQLDRVKGIVPKQKVKWSKKGKKLTASFHDLTPKELNKLLSKLFNVAVQIETLHIKRESSSYSMELKCKW
jgi:hypothetical protein